LQKTYNELFTCSKLYATLLYIHSWVLIFIGTAALGIYTRTQWVGRYYLSNVYEYVPS